MWVYWKERCLFCKNREDCEYKDRAQELIEKLTQAEKSVPKVYGTVDWKCDYYILDTDVYYARNKGECECK